MAAFPVSAARSACGPYHGSAAIYCDRRREERDGASSNWFHGLQTMNIVMRTTRTSRYHRTSRNAVVVGGRLKRCLTAFTTSWEEMLVGLSTSRTPSSSARRAIESRFAMRVIIPRIRGLLCARREISHHVPCPLLAIMLRRLSPRLISHVGQYGYPSAWYGYPLASVRLVPFYDRLTLSF